MELNNEIKSLLLKKEKKEGILKSAVECIESLDQFYKDHYIKTLTLPRVKSKDSDELIGKNSIVYIQTNLFRFKSISDSYIDSVNNQNPLGSIILLRALLETSGALGFLHKKYTQYKEEKLSKEKYFECLGSLQLGSKDKKYIPSAPDPVNVMNFIDAIDDYLKKNFNSKGKRFRDGYDKLSEYSHPNSLGNFLAYKVNIDLGILDFTNESESIPFEKHHLELFTITVEIYKFMFKNLKNQIIQHEKIPFIEFKN